VYKTKKASVTTALSGIAEISTLNRILLSSSDHAADPNTKEIALVEGPKESP
jgi:hypothetical protein